MAANDAIYVQTSKTIGQQVVSAANQLRNVKNVIGDIKNILDHMTDGLVDNGQAGVANNYYDLEIHLGLEAGKGAVLYTLISTLQTQINASAAAASFSTKVLPSA